MTYALVTGATSGIGLAIAIALLRDGCFVYINYENDASRADEVRRQLTAYDGRFELLRADLSEYSGIDAVVQTLRENESPLRYLVLNAAMTDRTPFGSITTERWESVMRMNLAVPFFLIQSLFGMELLEENGSVLCIGSLMGSIPHAASVSYGVSKAAMSALSQNLVKILSARGIRINGIEPGFIDTAWQKDKPMEQRERIAEKTALKRFGDPQEVADICLASLKNTYLTGAVIPVSGGYGLI